MLRNARHINGKIIDKKWAVDPNIITDSSYDVLIKEIKDYFVQRAMNQPTGRKNNKQSYIDCFDLCIEKWKTSVNELRRKGDLLFYHQYTFGKRPTKNVVLGATINQMYTHVQAVYELAPTSLRDTEDTLALGVVR